MSKTTSRSWPSGVLRRIVSKGIRSSSHGWVAPDCGLVATPVSVLSWIVMMLERTADEVTLLLSSLLLCVATHVSIVIVRRDNEEMQMVITMETGLPGVSSHWRTSASSPDSAPVTPSSNTTLSGSWRPGGAQQLSGCLSHGPNLATGDAIHVKSPTEMPISMNRVSTNIWKVKFSMPWPSPGTLVIKSLVSVL